MMDKTVIVPAHLIDINTKHSPDHYYETYGTGQWNLISCFRTPIAINTVQGRVCGQAGDCIIHSCDFTQWHGRAAEEKDGFRNDWLFADSETIISLMAQYQLPWDTLIPTGNSRLLENSIVTICHELAVADRYSNEAIIAQLSTILRDIWRAHDAEINYRQKLTASEQEHYQRMSRLRPCWLDNCVNPISISQLAGEMNLSPERFSALYRRFFSATPYDDLIKARLVIAKRLLSTSFMSVKEIAVTCGWLDCYYFSRIFRRHCGCSPIQFRQQWLGQNSGQISCKKEDL